MTTRPTLLEYAANRFRLAGKSILDGGHPWFMPLDRLKTEIEANGGSFVSFANYDYLGLAGHKAIHAAAARALDELGTGALGSRLVGGERMLHAEFESAMAKFLGADACLTLVSGYLTNITIISHLLGPRDLLIMDELCHNSIHCGAKSTKAELLTFRHNDLEHLDELLKTHRSAHRNCLIVVEGLYSMDGDLPDLPGLVALKHRHQCWLLVDEAHSIGVLGERGRGISEHFGVDPNEIDLIVGTLSKAFVSCGGFLCARQEIIDWLRFTLAGFVYSVGQSPIITASAHAALELLIAEPERIAKLRRNSEYFLKRAKAAGLNTEGAVGRGVVPVMFTDMHETMRQSVRLLEANIYAPPIVHVGVPKDAPRIRFFLSARHEPEEIDIAIDVMTDRHRAEPRPRMRAAQ
ncbi:MAG TPA: aminotransferase class I/II-fold pyridoxal phosphate-dependent enzyme [Xanthobacteraceae bacterium]|nr:aminotransferase class I/II-fold pyridoxal phosphate-dependent enzyme [Xanthobacteraceae bacterium]